MLRAPWLGLIVIGLAGLAGACAAPAKEALEIRDPRAVLMPPMGAVYLTVVNPGPQSDRLLRVETAAARRAETHESSVENGVMRMRAHPEGFEVPAGGTLALEPGGKHIMLVDPHLAAGAEQMALTLHFEKAGAVAVQALVAAPGAQP